MDQLPAYLVNRQRRQISDDVAKDIGGAMPPHISIASNRFTLVDGSGNRRPLDTLSLDCVIVAANPKRSQVYYDPAKGQYDPNEGRPPDCWSDNGVAPSVNAASPESATCELCPKREWSSAISARDGRGVPACRKKKKIAVLLPDFPDLPFLLTVPPASLGAIGAYVGMFKGRDFDVPDYFTRISFEAGVNGILKFEPSPLGYVTPELAAAADALDEDALDAMVGKHDQPRQALPAPAKAPQLAEQGGGAFGQLAPHLAKAPQLVAQQPAGAFGQAQAPQNAPPPPLLSTPFPAPAQAPKKRGRPPKVESTPQTAPFGGNGQIAAPFAPAPQQAPAVNPELEAALNRVFDLDTKE